MAKLLTLHGQVINSTAYIYILSCSISGRFFLPMGSKMRCFSCTWNEWKWRTKNVFPRWKVSSFQHKCTEMCTLVRTSNAFKNGALMSRNISTPLLNGYTQAILERFNSPSFHALFLTTSKSLKPLFLQRFVTISWVFRPPPQTEHQNIFRSQEDNCKSAFRK